MRYVNGTQLGYLNCPYCGKETEFAIGYSEAHIMCSDHNCLGMMSVHWGTHDEPYRFIEKMKANWNKRNPDTSTLIGAIDYIHKYRNVVYDDSQKEYSDCCAHCVEVVDDILDKLITFTR